MTSQSIRRVVSSIAKSFQLLQIKISSHHQPEEEKTDANRQSIYPTRCLSASKLKAARAEQATSGSQWWARLYRGLVIDPDARHYRQMGQAVWLYLYFLLNANWKTGRLYRRLTTVCEDTGINRFAVRRWLRVLQRNGYVNACYNGRFWVIEVNKWRPLALPFVRKLKSSKFSKSSKYRRSQS